MAPTGIECMASLCFALALLHTFSVKVFQNLAHRQKNSIAKNFFHLLGEVEVVFGFWAVLFLILYGFSEGFQNAFDYLETQDFTEPVFVFVVMAICATQPILAIASQLIEKFSLILPFKRPVSFYISCLVVGSLSGSLITEPAAMTVTALILLERFYTQGISKELKYATIGLLFVNISIGGTLTPYAAPPILMVADPWGWDLSFMLKNFGWKAVLATTLATLFVVYRHRNELAKFPWRKEASQKKSIPFWLGLSHLVFLAVIVVTAHYPKVFLGIFLIFLGFVTITKEHQEKLRLREGLLVASFLAGLVILGSPQRWWLEPLLTDLDAFPLFLGSIGLTAITDNAALTYLGAQVPTLTEFARYALVAGAVTGGGLTVIANAPNPAGYGILNGSFGREGIHPFCLFKSALIPTIIAAICFWFL